MLREEHPGGLAEAVADEGFDAHVRVRMLKMRGALEVVQSFRDDPLKRVPLAAAGSGRFSPP